MINKLLVIGSGTMGSGIAQVAAEGGLDVLMYDVDSERLQAALKTINGFLQKKVDKAKLTEEDKNRIIARIKLLGELGEEAGGCDFVIEAVFENFDVKVDLLKKLDPVLNPGAIIASNTSTLNITRMSESLKNPGRFIGMHFFSPVPVMRLVELIQGDHTAAATVEKAFEMVKVLGKTGILVKDIPGFIVNRFMCLMYNEAARLVESGVASASDIDTAMKLGANHRMGPLEIADMAGVDVVLLALEALYGMTGNESYKPAGLLRDMVKEGKLGRKTSIGFYNYNQ